MLLLRVSLLADQTDAVVEALTGDARVSTIAVLRGASVRPPGDLVLADVARVAANGVIDRLQALGVHKHGTIHLDPVSTWVSQSGFDSRLGDARAPTCAVVEGRPATLPGPARCRARVARLAPRPSSVEDGRARPPRRSSERSDLHVDPRAARSLPAQAPAVRTADRGGLQVL